jgi:protein-tyrosine kinase
MGTILVDAGRLSPLDAERIVHFQRDRGARLAIPARPWAC